MCTESLCLHIWYCGMIISLKGGSSQADVAEGPHRTGVEGHVTPSLRPARGGEQRLHEVRMPSYAHPFSCIMDPTQAGRLCAHSSSRECGVCAKYTGFPGQRGRTTVVKVKNSGVFHNFFLATKLRHFIITLSKKKSPVKKIKIFSGSNAWAVGVG